ncbi:hypothetical protein BCR44DRAFT_1426505 [Catenaria anguillulae PL171]|uniref:Uncharacterized protein n=1 Tax=Catenaria anguillulae PL171 TaxID=765915 RepID=A0A1Y2HY34_9FUNG|nr:hypothetical protein BCR44DRAFT_1426505 [Catenaria anguillulae PL171]
MPDSDAPTSQPTYLCSAPNCPLPPTTSFRSLSAVEAHIRKHHHHICRSARAPLARSLQCRVPVQSLARHSSARGTFAAVLGAEEDHMIKVHRWAVDRYEHVQRQVARGSSKYLRQGGGRGEDIAVDQQDMQVDQVIGAFMDMDTGEPGL